MYVIQTVSKCHLFSCTKLAAVDAFFIWNGIYTLMGNIPFEDREFDKHTSRKIFLMHVVFSL